jgi:DNA uptake protein ComE-like DNA-binding protein
MFWKDFFYFSRRERQGIILLLVFIAGIFVGKWIFTPAKLPPLAGTELTEEALSQTNASPDTIERPAYTPVFNNNRQQPSRNYSTRSPLQETKKTYYEQEKAPPTRPSPQTTKFPAGTVVELNEADTVLLMRIPGIGPSFAKRITAYRKVLGGFHRIEQLQEIYGMYEELYAQIAPYFNINPENIVCIPVNKASLEQLRAHPYLNFYQAKAIVELRKKRGQLTGIEDLQLLEEFTPEDWLRISSYLAF